MSKMKGAMRKAGYKHPRSSEPDSRKAPEFPVSYFETDNQNRSCLKPDFVSKKKVDLLAKLLATSCNPKLTTGQARRFFNHCREIERRLKADGENWLRVSASFESLCAHAQYAVATKKIPEEFQKFIDENVKRVVSTEEPRKAFLEGFLPHFEALIGFGATYLRRNR